MLTIEASHIDGKGRIIKTGSPIFEVIEKYKHKIENSNILEKLKLKKEGYFLVSAHREENINSSNFINLVENLFIRRLKERCFLLNFLNCSDNIYTKPCYYIQYVDI